MGRLRTGPGWGTDAAVRAGGDRSGVGGSGAEGNKGGDKNV